MTWSIEGPSMEACNCRSFCICNLGPTDLVEEWHCGACIWDIEKGHSDGVDLSGTMVAMAREMPGDFLSSGGTARLYIGDSADDEQRREIEALFTGQRGGSFASFDSSLPNMLPVQFTNISLVGGDRPTAMIGDFANLVLRRYKTESGKQTTLNDGLFLEPYGVVSEEIGDTSGSRWSDPEMREWNGGAGGWAMFKLSSL